MSCNSYAIAFTASTLAGGPSDGPSVGALRPHSRLPICVALPQPPLLDTVRRRNRVRGSLLRRADIAATLKRVSELGAGLPNQLASHGAREGLDQHVKVTRRRCNLKSCPTRTFPGRWHGGDRSCSAFTVLLESGHRRIRSSFCILSLSPIFALNFCRSRSARTLTNFWSIPRVLVSSVLRS